VELRPGAEGNGLACMLAELLKENLQNPAKRWILESMHGRVGIVARDADVAMTIDMGDGRVAIHDGLLPSRDLTITTDSEKITSLSLLAVKFGLPVFHDEAGRAVVKDLLSGVVKIDGLLRHPVLLTKLTLLMSVNG
jgi:hypothetical protein